MTALIIGLALFILTHMIPSVSRLRTALVSRLGNNGYQGVFSLFALSGLSLIVYGKMSAPTIELWVAPEWGITVVHSLMPFAFILFCAAYLPSSVKNVSRHPMLWGMVLWALLHLLTNGDLSSAVLFGSLGLFAFAKIFLIGNRQSPELGARMPIAKDLILIVAGLVDYGIFLYFHRWVSGVELLS